MLPKAEMEPLKLTTLALFSPIHHHIDNCGKVPQRIIIFKSPPLDKH